MRVPAIDILVVTDDPSHAAYLSAVLQLESPGRFKVRQAAKQGMPRAGRADLVLLLAEPAEAEALGLLAGPALDGASPPVIVVAGGPLDLDTLGRLMLEGADDVIDLGRLTPRGLASAVLKAVRRRTRAPIPWPQAAGGFVAVGG